MKCLMQCLVKNKKIIGNWSTIKIFVCGSPIFNCPSLLNSRAYHPPLWFLKASGTSHMLTTQDTAMYNSISSST